MLGATLVMTFRMYSSGFCDHHQESLPFESGKRCGGDLEQDLSQGHTHAVYPPGAPHASLHINADKISSWPIQPLSGVMIGIDICYNLHSAFGNWFPGSKTLTSQVRGPRMNTHTSRTCSPPCSLLGLGIRSADSLLTMPPPLAHVPRPWARS